MQYVPELRVVLSAWLDATLKPFCSDTLAQLQVFAGHYKGVTCFSASRTQGLVVSGSMDHTLCMWDIHTGKRLATLVGHAGAVLSVCINDGVSASTQKEKKLALLRKLREKAKCTRTRLREQQDIRIISTQNSSEHIIILPSQSVSSTPAPPFSPSSTQPMDGTDSRRDLSALSSDTALLLVAESNAACD